MLRDQVRPMLVAQIARLEADAGLQALYPPVVDGARIIRRFSIGAINTDVAGVYWHIVSETPQETSWTAVVDFDVWALSYGQCRAMGDRLVAVLHKEMPEQIGGQLCWSQLMAAEDLGDPGPDGVSRRLYRFRMEPVRDRAAH